MDPVKTLGESSMALEYTEEKLNGLDKETIIELFLSQQEQLKQIDHNLQLVLEQMSDLKRHRFGRSSERHETEDQISFMEVDGKIVFFNESEAVSSEESDGSQEDAPRRKPKKKQGNGKKSWKGFRLLWWSIPWMKRSLRKNSDRKDGNSSLTKYTADTALPRQRSKWRNTM